MLTLCVCFDYLPSKLRKKYLAFWPKVGFLDIQGNDKELKEITLPSYSSNFKEKEKKKKYCILNFFLIIHFYRDFLQTVYNT